MAHKHSIYDTDPHFSIDPATREIANQSDKVVIMQYDHNSERFTFDLPRKIDDHDMSQCNRVRVHYINIDAMTRESNAAVYEVTDLQVSPDGEDVVIFSWLVSQNATKKVGSLNFRIELACLADDATVDYAWHTAIYSGITVSDGIYNSEVVVEQYADILEQWKQELTEKYGDTATAAETATTAASQASDSAVSAQEAAKEAKASAEEAEQAAKDVNALGTVVLKKGDGVDSAAQVSTTGNDNTAYAPAGTALGMGAVSGIKGFHMVSVDTENLLITVDDAGLEEKAAEKYAVGDELQFDAKNHNYFSLEIVSLATNDAGQSVIGVKQTTEKALNLTLDADPNENYCWVVGKNYGEIFPMARAAHSEGEGAIAAGRCAHAEGRDTKVIGNYGHAEGRDTVAGYIAHAEGRATTASGGYSHAEGHGTVSKGSYSHAEGMSTKAISMWSHSEGIETQAIGDYSHAEGKQTRAEGPGAHAEGYASIAKGGNSHAEGTSTEAIGSFTHAEGYNTTAGDYVKDDNGNYLDADGNITTDSSKYVIDAEKYAQHAEGANTKALGIFSHAEGTGTTAEGKASHSEGANTYAKGDNSHAEGKQTEASGKYAHAEGEHSKATGSHSHAEGYMSTASGSNAHAEGGITKASGPYSHAEGNSTIANGASTHAEGQSTRATGVSSHAEGKGTIAGGNQQHVQGRFNVVDNNHVYAHIVGGGTSDTDRKNIYTLDWEGNAMFAGGHITVGGATLTAATIKLLEGLTVSEGVAF